MGVILGLFIYFMFDFHAKPFVTGMYCAMIYWAMTYARILYTALFNKLYKEYCGFKTKEKQKNLKAN